VNGVDDVTDYKEMRQAMGVLAFTDAEQEVSS
jgi:myosin heavy subunit